MKEPSVGCLVKVTFPEEEVTGEVLWVGSAQFTFKQTDTERVRFCMFNGVYEITKRPDELSISDKQKKAKELYEEYNNYAKVARELGVHPTTIRTWLK